MTAPAQPPRSKAEEEACIERASLHRTLRHFRATLKKTGDTRAHRVKQRLSQGAIPVPSEEDLEELSPINGGTAKD